MDTNCPLYQKDLGIKKLTDVLEHGQTVKWKTTKSRSIEQFLPDGILKSYQIEITEEEHIEQLPTPQWAIERVIPKNIDEAISIVRQYGLDVVIGDEALFSEWIATQTRQKGDKSDTGEGLTESAANIIRARILGIPV